MPLRGTLADYGLADVLQLISAGVRSGHLEIEHREETLEVIVALGTVVDVRTDLPPDAALGARLVGAGVLKDDRLGWALAERARTGLPIARVLTQTGELSPTQVREQATLQRWDTVLTPFTWSEGRYAFREAEIPLTEGWSAPIRVEQLLLRGLRLVEEWPTAVARVPSASWFVAARRPLAAPLDEAIFEVAFDPAASVGDPLSDEARQIHHLAVPGIRVGEILGRAPHDRYQTTLALSELIGAGLLELSTP